MRQIVLALLLGVLSLAAMPVVVGSGTITTSAPVKVLDGHSRDSACVRFSIPVHCAWGNPQDEPNPTAPNSTVGWPIPADRLEWCERAPEFSAMAISSRVDCIADGFNGTFTTIEGGR